MPNPRELKTPRYGTKTIPSRELLVQSTRDSHSPKGLWVAERSSLAGGFVFPLAGIIKTIPSMLKKLQLQSVIKVAKGNSKIICYIRGVEIVETPEEKVRQEYARRLVEEYGYPKELVDVEVPIKLGRDESKKADIVVYRSKQDREKRENHYIIVECKEPDIKYPDGESQLKSYINATTTQIGVWTNGVEFKYWKRLKEPDRYEEKGYLPK